VHASRETSRGFRSCCCRRLMSRWVIIFFIQPVAWWWSTTRRRQLLFGRFHSHSNGIAHPQTVESYSKGLQHRAHCNGHHAPDASYATAAPLTYATPFSTTASSSTRGRRADWPSGTLAPSASEPREIVFIEGSRAGKRCGPRDRRAWTRVRLRTCSRARRERRCPCCHCWSATVPTCSPRTAPVPPHSSSPRTRCGMENKVFDIQLSAVTIPRPRTALMTTDVSVGPG
jgi:hypothetical protein